MSRSSLSLIRRSAICAISITGLLGAPVSGSAAPRLLAGDLVLLADRGRVGGSPVMDAVERLAAESESPVRTRGLLLARLRSSMACYRGDLTADEWTRVLRETKFLPPGVHEQQDRFYVDAFCWLGDGGQGQANTSRRASLTYSFAPDGTLWGLSCAFNAPAGASTLDAALVSQFGSLDRGREFIRSSIASWRRYAALSYTEVADNGTAQDIMIARLPDRGDIRIGGRALGATSSFPLAYNAFPSPSGFTGCSGGDMFINTSYFTPSFFGLTIGNFLYFRNTVAHEHGHGLGYRHSVPCDRTKLMEPQISVDVTLLSRDEIRAAIANYGDRFAPNHSTSTATNFGDLTSPAPRSVIERDLGLNGTVVIVNSQTTLQDDYFRFSLASAQNVTISVTPTGASQLMGLQSTGCDPTNPLVTVNAQQAGNLAMQLLTQGQAIIAQATGAPIGAPETITQNLSAGTYFVRVWDIGGGPSVNQVLQTYDLEIDVGGTPAPPRAIAGLNKRVRAGELAQFIGNHLSHANEPGATIPSGNYSWDLDGNGVFETQTNSQPTFTYPSNGQYNATLRVTDTNGLSATDTIQVVVFGALTSVTGVSPSSGATGTSVPVTITGVNFKGVLSATQVSVAGSGVSVTGAPVVNALGTQITGLSMVVSPTASIGPRDVTITNSDGQGSSGVGIGRFGVTTGAPTGACCAADGSCTTQTSSTCAQGGGTYRGDGAACSPNPCPQASGACCDGTLCTVVVASSCTSPTSRFVGAGIACNTPGNLVSPCCKADFTQSGGDTVQDVFDFLDAWFNNDPRCNFNADAGVSLQDLFDFVAAWFVGCA